MTEKVILPNSFKNPVPSISQVLSGSEQSSGGQTPKPPVTTTPAPSTSSSPQPKLDSQPSLQQTINKVTEPYLNTLAKTVAAYKAYNPSSASGFSNMSPELQSAVTNMQKLTGKALTNLVPEVKQATESAVSSNQISSLLTYVASRLVYGDILGAPSQISSDKGVQGLYNLFNSISTSGIGAGATGQSGPASANAAAQISQTINQLGGQQPATTPSP